MRLPSIAALAALAIAVSSAAGAATTPSVRILDLTPVSVRGTHFSAAERVVVTLRAGSDKRVRTVRTTNRGAFTVGFGTLAEEDRCSGSVGVTAAGAHGDRASYGLPTLACPAMAASRYER